MARIARINITDGTSVSYKLTTVQDENLTIIVTNNDIISEASFEISGVSTSGVSKIIKNNAVIFSCSTVFINSLKPKELLNASITVNNTTISVKLYVYTHDTPVVDDAFKKLTDKIKDIQNVTDQTSDGLKALNLATVKVDDFEAYKAKINEILIDTATISDLTAANLKFTIGNGEQLNLQELLTHILSADNGHIINLTSDNVKIQNALITDAMIKDVTAGKIISGSIDTSKVNIQSEDGSMRLTGSLLQFTDDYGNVRIQMGLDGNRIYSLKIADEEGRILFDTTGITNAGVQNGIITNDKISENANINGGKIDIASLIKKVNESGEIIKASKIGYDADGQTLYAKFYSVDEKIDKNISSIETNHSDIVATNGRIDSLLERTTVIKDGNEVAINEAHSELEQKVDGISSTVSETTTKVNKISSRVETNESNISQLSNEIKLKVTQTDIDNTVKKVVISTVTEYYLSNKNNSLDGGTWSTTAPAWVNGKYMWSRTKLTFKDGTTSTGTPTCISGAVGPQGTKGDTGATGPQGPKGATGSTGPSGKTPYLHIKYSNDGGKTFTSNSGEDAGTYIGTCTDYNTADPTAVSSYSWAKIQGPQGPQGNTGATGKGLKSTTITYQASTSGTAAPTGTWSSIVPTVSANQYLWTKTVFTYTDNTTTTAYSVGKMGATGATGPAGPKGDTGATGNGVKSIVAQYYLSTSKISQTGGSWVTTCPAWKLGTYLWTRNHITYTNGSTAYTTPMVDSSWEAVNDIQIGGNNLAVSSKIVANGAKSATYDKSSHTWTITVANGAGGTWGAGLRLNNILHAYGKPRILSFEVLSPKACTWNSDTNNQYITGTASSSNDNDNTSKRKMSSNSIPANVWTKCWVYAENTNSNNTSKRDLNDTSTIGIVNNTGSDLTVKIRNIQYEYATKPSEFNLPYEEVEQRITTAEQKILPDKIINAINQAIVKGVDGKDVSINTVNTVLDKNGFTINNGAFTIKDSSGNIALNGDTSGNLTLRKSLNVGGSVSGIINVKDGSNANIATIDKNGITVEGNKFKCVGKTASGEFYDIVKTQMSTKGLSMDMYCIDKDGNVITENPGHTEYLTDGIETNNSYSISASSPSGGNTSFLLMDSLSTKIRTSDLTINSSFVTMDGTLVLTNPTDLDGKTDTNPALIIGKKNGVHLEMDDNEIHAKSSAAVPSDLYLNSNGGSVFVGGSKVITDVASSLSGNGYMKLNNGLILQWGKTLITGLTADTFKTVTVTFPISFPHSVLSIQFSVDSSFAECIAQGTSITAKNFGIAFKRKGNSYDTTVYWFAIGY